MYIGKDMFDFTPILIRIVRIPLAVAVIAGLIITIVGIISYLGMTYPIYWIITGKSFNKRMEEFDEIEFGGGQYNKLIDFTFGKDSQGKNQ